MMTTSRAGITRNNSPMRPSINNNPKFLVSETNGGVEIAHVINIPGDTPRRPDMGLIGLSETDIECECIGRNKTKKEQELNHLFLTRQRTIYNNFYWSFEMTDIMLPPILFFWCEFKRNRDRLSIDDDYKAVDPSKATKSIVTNSSLSTPLLHCQGPPSESHE